MISAKDPGHEVSSIIVNRESDTVIYLLDGTNYSYPHPEVEALGTVVRLREPAERARTYAPYADEEVITPLGHRHAAWLSCEATVEVERLAGIRPRRRVIVGASMGGLAAITCQALFPQRWHCAVAMSPTIGWAGGRAGRLWVQRRCDHGKGPRLYVDAGGNPEMNNDNRWAVLKFRYWVQLAGLRTNDLPDPDVRFALHDGDPHAWSAWNRRLPGAVSAVLDMARR